MGQRNAGEIWGPKSPVFVAPVPRPDFRCILTAQQPENNVIRVSLQALAAVLGGCQSLHTNGKDEAWALPSEEAALQALRTQQIIAHETGVTDTVDPLGGGYFLETLTNQVEAAGYDYFRRIDDLGGVIPGLEIGFFQREIADAAYVYQQEEDSKERITVGVNEYLTDDGLDIPLLKVDRAGEQLQIDRLNDLRRSRDNRDVAEKLGVLKQAARGSENLMPALLDAVNAYATPGRDDGRVPGSFWRVPAFLEFLAPHPHQISTALAPEDR